jgi:hypothetical protein
MKKLFFMWGKKGGTEIKFFPKLTKKIVAAPFYIPNVR